ncbi:alternative ribosome rescue aminoacyl-tRNA hydrolase ArfB [Flavobacterium sp. HSC-61S13]|uniref:alternative ribosome rescue aminoacyl-tRNA hydrolase ArfB n=1 Tax=Flavobacterium sp. HSC-61S13 TaxID=2910963 RepID=UPI0020A10D16|nr:ribosome-associated protein [Flavobacterium sp. HSC-61S13]
MNKEKLLSELQFKAIRSGGAGGQHVNKVSSKVVLTWDLSKTVAFSEEQIGRLESMLRNRLSKEAVLQLECDATRSQIRNKDGAIERFFSILETALIREKPRRATKVSRSVIRKRKDNKQQLSLKKAMRRRPDFD